MNLRLLLAVVVFPVLFYESTALGWALLRGLKDIFCGSMATTTTTTTPPTIFNLTQNTTGALGFIVRALSDQSSGSPVIYAPIFNWAQVPANETSP
ncbi:PREDICTED: uncharacterized protein LOC108971523 [Bactrocera latifrons]|uniref:uncharacterized protein LOC108971523 n=1 Tax=Bactrocera latifrons TaxID=174628 RepID=UPI0008DCA6C5|nr:PREDICTED: uncharacterized protein LOC108971523 [Bactrocera latifrons]